MNGTDGTINVRYSGMLGNFKLDVSLKLRRGDNRPISALGVRQNDCSALRGGP